MDPRNLYFSRTLPDGLFQQVQIQFFTVSKDTSLKISKNFTTKFPQWTQILL